MRQVGFQRLLVIMRNRFQEGKSHACQETAKPMSRRKSKPNATPMSRYCEADVNAMLEVLLKVCWVSKVVGVNAKPMSRMEVHTHTNKWTPNGNTRPYLFYICLQ